MRQTGTDTLTLLHDADPEAGGEAPSGDALFRLLPPGSERTRTTPIYPDPCAEMLVMSASAPGLATPVMFAVPLYRDDHLDGVIPRTYPDALPVVLDLVPAEGSGAPPASIHYAGHGRSGEGASVSHYGVGGTIRPGRGGPSDVSIRHVEIALAPGVEATISMWFLPSLAALTHVFDAPESLGILASAGQNSSQARKDAFRALTGKAIERGEVVARGGIGGLSTPDEAMRADIASLLHRRMGLAPIPELAAVTGLRATFAVNIPAAAPTISDGSLRLLRVDGGTRARILAYVPGEDPPSGLQDPATWSHEAQVSGAVDVLLAGSITFDPRSTDALEVLARGPAAVTGVFDDVLRGRSREARARGLWPRRANGDHLGTSSLFGFDVADDGRVTLPTDEVALLRLKRLPASLVKAGQQSGAVDLLALQREDVRLTPAPGKADEHPGRPVIERPAGFPDGKARKLRIRVSGHGRHAGLFRTRTDAVLEDADLVGPAVERWLDATRRPDRISPRSLLPAFCWAPVDGATGVTRTMVVRVRMQRPWFTSGEGERLGVVLWPPDLFEIEPVLVDQDLLPRPVDDLGSSLMSVAHFADEQLGTGGPFVTRWGGDPIRGGATPSGWLLSRANFPGHHEWPDAGEPGPDAVLVRDVLMPLPRAKEGTVDTHRSAEDFLRVSLLTFEPRFDPEEEVWYADVEVDPAGVPDPFLRLGLCRFQPHAPRALQTSEPVVEWVQVLPQRRVSVRLAPATELDGSPKGVPARSRVIVDVTGPGSSMAYPAPNVDDVRAQRPVMEMRLVERSRALSGLWCEELVRDAEGRGCVREDVVPTLAAEGLRWSGEFVLDAHRLERSGGRVALAVEETELRRPSSYAVEPFERGISEDVLVRSGPRFAAKVDLSKLKGL